ncbi:MAG TPA: DUF3332 family protein [Candidatus Cloacimonetes bacterium]|nr:DUF3332 family protein [Candidatus Cloacimonadota bacterium]
MRKVIKLVSMLVVTVMLLSIISGCFGSFNLTRKLYKWNEDVGDKWTNTAVLWVFMIIPVYEVCGFIDFAILNTVEFWTGENPLEMTHSDKEIKTIEVNGKIYNVITTMNRYNIKLVNTEDAGKSISLVFKPETKTWEMITEDDVITVVELGNKIKF